MPVATFLVVWSLNLRDYGWGDSRFVDRRGAVVVSGVSAQLRGGGVWRVR